MELVTVAELNTWEEAQTYNDRPAESSFWDMYGGQGDWYTGYRNRGNPCHWGYYQHNKQKSEASKNYILSQHGIIAKAGTNGELFVAVTTLNDAKPAAGVRVRVTDYQQSVIGEALTDANGMVILTPKGKPYVVETTRGDAFGILRVSNGDSSFTATLRLQEQSRSVASRGSSSASVMCGVRGIRSI